MFNYIAVKTVYSKVYPISDGKTPYYNLVCLSWCFGNCRHLPMDPDKRNNNDNDILMKFTILVIYYSFMYFTSIL